MLGQKLVSAQKGPFFYLQFKFLFVMLFKESKQTVPFQNNRLKVDNVKIDVICIPFRDFKLLFLKLFLFFLAQNGEFCLFTLLSSVFVFPVVIL